MGVIRRADSQLVARDAIVLDLGDLLRQGEALKERTRREAAAMLVQGQDERRKLIEGGREEGFAAGKAEGFARGAEEGRKAGAAAALAERRAEIEQSLAGLTLALESFARERESMLAEARRDLLLLAAAIAQRVVKRRVELDPASVAAEMEAALSLVARRTKLVLHVAPRDEALAKEAAPALMARYPMAESVEFTADPSLSPGSCVARTAGGGLIDASIETQLRRLVEALVPGGAAPAPPPGAAP